MDTGLTEIDLSNFTGQSPEHYDRPFVMEALAQAGDLLELALSSVSITELPPANTLLGRTARRGVLAMAEAIFEGNNHRDMRFSPFKTENIGSYSYTLAEQNVLAGIPSGVSWFDVAVSKLLDAAADAFTSTISNASISAFDRPGDIGWAGGRPILTGPADTENFRQGPPLESGGGMYR
ncbi:MAG: hypothetical protein WC054_00865 [Candidatus Nanopelagicales bacterium]